MMPNVDLHQLQIKESPLGHRSRIQDRKEELLLHGLRFQRLHLSSEAQTQNSPHPAVLAVAVK